VYSIQVIQRENHNQPRLLIHVRTINNLGESRHNKPKSKEESHPCEVYSIQVIQRDSHNHSRLPIHVRRIYDVGEFYRYKMQKQNPTKVQYAVFEASSLEFYPLNFGGMLYMYILKVTVKD
jgi:hypothetical protein